MRTLTALMLIAVCVVIAQATGSPLFDKHVGFGGHWYEHDLDGWFYPWRYCRRYRERGRDRDDGRSRTSTTTTTTRSAVVTLPALVTPPPTPPPTTSNAVG